MSVYVIIEIKILDPEIYARYVAAVPPIVKKYGGRYLTRGGEITGLFGDWRPERLILLEFDSRDRVEAWLASPEYTHVAPLRENSTVTRAVVIESGPVP